MKTHLTCPCGTLIVGKDEEDLVAKAYEHLREAHPELAKAYSPEDILFMAY